MLKSRNSDIRPFECLGICEFIVEIVCDVKLVE